MTITEMDLAAELAKVDNNQLGYYRMLARAAAEQLGVELPPAPKPLPTEPDSVVIATEVRGETGRWRMMLDDEGRWNSPVRINHSYVHRPEQITAWTPARVVPDGESIDLSDVEDGNRVRVELVSGDEVTFTVTDVLPSFLTSKHNYFPIDAIRAAYLLHREEA